MMMRGLISHCCSKIKKLSPSTCLAWVQLLLPDAMNFIPANSHALGVSLTPVGRKLRSHASSCLRANFSRLIEKCEFLPSCLTQFPKIC